MQPKSRLKNIKLFGFKSFAERTTLEFSAGITVIVGPNGCGKSNIADAFRWALGTQSARTLRGEKMEDFIFSGTSTRKAFNIAEVSLTLLNEEQELNFKANEICVQRRIHRDGEAQYLLNGQQVRLKDVQDIFLDSGVSKDSFTLIEQSKVDQIISCSPFDRRSVFEEAAGVMRFKLRRKETLQKLELLQPNLMRLQDIYREVAQQVAILEQQAQIAMQYKEKQKHIKEIEQSIVVTNYATNTQHDRSLGSQIEQLKQQLQCNVQEKNQMQKQLQEKQKNKSDVHELVQQMQEQRMQLKHTCTLFESRQLHLQREQQDAKVRHHKLEIEQTQLHAQQQQTDAEIERNIPHKNKLQEDFILLSRDVSENKLQLQQKQQTIRHLQQQQRDVQQKHVAIVQKYVSTQGEMKLWQAKQHSLQERLQQRQRQLEELIQTQNECTLSLEEKKQHLQELAYSIDAQKSEIKAAALAQRELEKEYKIAHGAVSALRKVQEEAQARQKAIAQIHQNLEGLSSATQALLKESKNTKSILFGRVRPLYDCIKAIEGKEELLSVALRQYAHTVVVDTKEDLERVLSYSKKQSLQDFSVLCLEHISVSKKEMQKTKEHSLFSIVEPSALAFHLLHEVYLSNTTIDAAAFDTKLGQVHLFLEDSLLDEKHVLLLCM